MLQCVAVCCSVLQCVAVCCSVMYCFAYPLECPQREGPKALVVTFIGFNTLCCSVLQCVAVCCSVLQCVAVCCSVLQCVAVCCSGRKSCDASVQGISRGGSMLQSEV